MLTDSQRAYMALEAAMRAGNLDAVRAAFTDEPAFPNVRDPLTWTHLLALAISWSPLPLVSTLLDLGADPNFEAPDGFPAVYGALATRRPDTLDLIALLVSRGADVNARGINDYTPLHYAVSLGDEKATALLLASGADPQLRTRIDHYATALEEAELTGNSAGARMLTRLLSVKCTDA